MAHYDLKTKCRRRSTSYIILASLILCGGALPEVAEAARRLASQEDARHLGLTRVWFSQVRLNPARNHVERAVLRGDRLTILTSAGVVQEFNALTGETIWIAPVGNPDHPSLGPAANDDYVAVLNGSNVFVLDRRDGKPVMVRSVGGAPGAAPALAKQYVFVPLVTGRIEAYPLAEQKLTPWFYQSAGRALVAPLATPESVVWTTDRGHVYVGRGNELGVRFRVELRSEIVAPPAYRAPFVYVAAISGEVFAVHETLGARRWKYATGFLVTRPPAAVGDRVFVTSDEPALHCIDALTGNGLWEASGINQFAAISRDRVYGVDSLGGLVVLDAATGEVFGRVPNDITTNAMVNDQTDRVYLVSRDGVVQCLHELGATEPLYHVAPPTDPPPPDEPTVTPEAVEPEQPVLEESPFEAEMPADDFGVGEDPFDF